MIAMVLFGSLALLLIIGVPISISVGASALATILICYPDLPVLVIAQRLFTSLDNVSIMAIPYFVLAGNLMTGGGISRRIVAFVNSLVGNIRGGLGYVAVVACAFFSALSGSAPATVLAIGSMLYPEMVKLGYPKERCAGLLAVSGGLGPVIPPSIIMVVYCTITSCSVTDLFTLGLYVGILIALLLAVLVFYYAKKEEWPKNDTKINIREVMHNFIRATPALLMPVIILGSIYSGLMTPTESAATAVVYSMIVGLFVYRELKWSDLPKILLASAKGCAMVMFIIATASSFAWLFTYSSLSTQIVSFITGMNMSSVVFCILVTILLLIFGTFLEGTAMCVLLVPVLYPVASSLGISVLEFGLIVCVAGVIGAMTPPVAVNVFAACSVSGLSIGQVAKGEIPFFLGFVSVLFFIAIFPGFFAAFVR